MHNITRHFVIVRILNSLLFDSPRAAILVPIRVIRKMYIIKYTNGLFRLKDNVSFYKLLLCPNHCGVVYNDMN